MTRIKICGITNLEDALAAVELGADALGFILVPGTPRYIGSWAEALDLPLRIPPFVTRVAVCRREDELPDELADRFDAVQFYSGGLEREPWAGKRAIQVARVRDRASLAPIIEGCGASDALLLDAYHAEKLGGIGETFDWSLAVEARQRLDKPVILAGGLTPENVARAIRAVRPYAVDVSSGVEAEPGRKDHDKLRRFFEAVREADRTS